MSFLRTNIAFFLSYQTSIRRLAAIGSVALSTLLSPSVSVAQTASTFHERSQVSLQTAAYAPASLGKAASYSSVASND
jgi:hypothetical protein